MQTLKRIRYDTMNSWNNSTAPAYNLKVYNVIDKDLQDKVYKLLEVEEYHEIINALMRRFDLDNDYQWQAGFNGRSGGYLVLYHGGKQTAHYTKEDFKSNNGYNGRVYISDSYGWMSYDEAKATNLVDRTIITSVYSQPGLSIADDEPPAEVLKAFRKLAVAIVKTTEWLARSCTIEDKEYTVKKTRKVLIE